MYNTHRGMVPAPNSRLTELLDQLRQEFENQSRSTGEFEHQCMYPHSPSSFLPRFSFTAPNGNVESPLSGFPLPTVQMSPVHLWLRLMGREIR